MDVSFKDRKSKEASTSIFRNYRRKKLDLNNYCSQMTKFQKRLLLFVVAVIFFGFVVLMKDDINKTGKASRLHFPMPPSFEVHTKGDIEEVKEIIPKKVKEQTSTSTSTSKPIKKIKEEKDYRQKAVAAAAQHSWKGYKKYAWGHDNLKPVSKSHHDVFGLGLTIIDSIDTLFLMDLKEEYEEARQWIEKSLSFDINREVNLFEVTIRVLGGLLSIYHLTDDSMYLAKAVELADRLMPCFNSKSSIPFSDINLMTKKAKNPNPTGDGSTSEVSTIQLEFRDLSRILKDGIYEDAIEKVSKRLHDLPKVDGLVPIYINTRSGEFADFGTITLGARGDSYYEYLLKQWLQIGKIANHYLFQDYVTAVEGIYKHLRKETNNYGHVFIGELNHGDISDFEPKMDSLVCYLPGTLLLGFKNGMPKTHLTLAVDLLETCYQTYVKQPTKLSPEINLFGMKNYRPNDIYFHPSDTHNLQRPEFIESLYYFWVITGNKTYQDMGWEIFKAFEKFTKVKHGYTSIGDVTDIDNTRTKDLMESYWIAETLKYFYLLFSDQKTVDHNKYVFNTEGHLIPIRNSFEDLI